MSHIGCDNCRRCILLGQLDTKRAYIMTALEMLESVLGLALPEINIAK